LQFQKHEDSLLLSLVSLEQNRKDNIDYPVDAIFLHHEIRGIISLWWVRNKSS